MSSLHGTVIPLKELKRTFPVRYHYTDLQERENINQILNEEKEILFLPTFTKETAVQDVKYEKAKYKIILNGIFTDGRRVNVIIDGIKPYFEVRVPDSVDGKIKMGRGSKIKYITEDRYIKDLRQLLNRDVLTTPIETSVFYGKPFKYYQTHESKFLRFYYYKTKSRKYAIKTVRDTGYETTHDDLSCYYRVVCRDYLTSLSMWVTLTEYKEEEVTCIKSHNKISTYRVHIDNYKMFTGEMNSKLLKDKTLSMTWDIETWSPEGDVPLPEYEDHKMFCIGATFQWVNDDKPFLRVALVDYPGNASPIENAYLANMDEVCCQIEKHREDGDVKKLQSVINQYKDMVDHPPGFVTVVCGSEKNVIKAFGLLFERMTPDFIIGFNDSDYDWNWLIKRAFETQGLVSNLAEKLDSSVPWTSYTDENVMKFNFKKENVKVEATMYAEGWTLMMDGYIPIDVRTVFRKLYPTAESSSLKWFLDKNKLGGKEDMPYQVMFKIYGDMNKIRNSEHVMFREGIDIDFKFKAGAPSELISEYQELKQKLYKVNNYCIVDALRCHELCKIRSVIMDHREVSNVAYTSVFDAFYRANGMKVRNLTIAVGQDKSLPFNIRFTNITNQVSDEGKYPGAYVFPPKKGLQTSKLTIPERIRKAEMTKDSKRKSMQYWLNTDEAEVQKFYSIIKKHGPFVNSNNKIAKIEEEWGNLPKKFIEFMSEHMGRPITGLDFASLYPSLMRCYNYSPEMCIKDKYFAKKIHTTGQKLNKVDFDFSGRRCKGWFVWHNNKTDPAEEGFQFGLYPHILDILFKKRKGIKKCMKIFAHEIEQMDLESAEYLKEHAEHYESINFDHNYLNSKQKALKVFMNTFYGEAGNKLSPFFVVEVAGGITMSGQKNIKMSQEYVESKDHEVYYGDSVAEYTPVWVRVNGEISFGEIQDLADNEEYKQYNDSKEIAILTGYEIWSDAGWTKINHIIRHKTDKKMYRVLTRSSCIDVTEDHSLLNEDGKEVTPDEVCVGDKLMLKELKLDEGRTGIVSAKLADVIGFFIAAGNCSIHGSKYTWSISINNNNQDLLRQLHNAKDVLTREYPGYEFKILASSAVYKLVPCNRIKGEIRDFVQAWRDMCYLGKSKIVPGNILSSTKDIQTEFFKGYYFGLGNCCYIYNTFTTQIDTESQITAATFMKLAQSIGFYVLIDTPCNEEHIYRLTITSVDHRENPNVIKKIIWLPNTTAYVYDIETGNHHFAAGVGDLIAHNTDSIYLACANKHFEEVDRLYYSDQLTKLEYWTKLVEITFDVIKPLNDEVNEMFYQDNKTRFLSMAYEEALFPVAFTAKKKYFGIPHENVPNFNPKQLFIRGLEVKKRGVSGLLKKIFNELMWTSCVDRDNLFTPIELSLTKIDDIYTNRTWELDDFVETAVYRPTKNNVKVCRFVGRMSERNVVVPANERFGYVIIKKYPYSYDSRGRKSELGVGDKMEYTETARIEKLDVDLDHYMKGSVNGQLARLIVYHEMFHVDPLDNSDEELKIAEDRMFKHAGKFINQYASQYYSQYNTFGGAYQKVFRTANKLVSSRIKTRDPLTHQLITANVPDSGFEEWFIETIDKRAVKLSSMYGPETLAKELAALRCPKVKGVNMTKDEKVVSASKRRDKIMMLQQVFYGSRDSLMNQRTKAFRETMSILRRRIREHIGEFRKVYSRYQGCVNGISNIIKNQLAIDKTLFDPTRDETKYKLDDFGDIDEELMDELGAQADADAVELLESEVLIGIINKMKTLYKDILSAHLIYRRTQSMVDALKANRDRSTGVIARPDEESIENTIAADINAAMEDIEYIGDLGMF
jgi:DNA polymerase elongation subunit (family B)